MVISTPFISPSPGAEKHVAASFSSHSLPSLPWGQGKCRDPSCSWEERSPPWWAVTGNQAAVAGELDSSGGSTGATWRWLEGAHDFRQAEALDPSVLVFVPCSLEETAGQPGDWEFVYPAPSLVPSPCSCECGRVEPRGVSAAEEAGAVLAHCHSPLPTRGTVSGWFLSAQAFQRAPFLSSLVAFSLSGPCTPPYPEPLGPRHWATVILKAVCTFFSFPREDFCVDPPGWSVRTVLGHGGNMVSWLERWALPRSSGGEGLGCQEGDPRGPTPVGRQVPCGPSASGEAWELISGS